MLYLLSKKDVIGAIYIIIFLLMQQASVASMKATPLDINMSAP